jgi:hypothetical protein
MGFLAMQWSARTAFQTASNDKVQLNNAPDHVIGPTTLTNTGEFPGFSGSVAIQVIDPNTPIGHISLWAVLSFAKLPQTTLNVSRTVANPVTSRPNPLSTPNLQALQEFKLPATDFSPGPSITITINGTQTLGAATQRRPSNGPVARMICTP